MNDKDRISRGEIILVVFLVVCFALVWSKWPEIRVSSKSLESYNTSDPKNPSWSNGIGLSIKARRLDGEAKDQLDFQEHRELTERYTAFVVDVNIEGTKYPTMVDLPYQRLSLTDNSGRVYRLVNQELARQSADSGLRQALEKFDWSIVNNTFTRQGRNEKGLLLFEPKATGDEQLVLHLNVYHHPYKQLNLSFSFPRQQDQSRATLK